MNNMSDQMKLGSVLLIALCCVWPVISYFVISRFGRIMRGIGSMFDRLINRSKYQ